VTLEKVTEQPEAMQAGEGPAEEEQGEAEVSGQADMMAEDGGGEKARTRWKWVPVTSTPE